MKIMTSKLVFYGLFSWIFVVLIFAYLTAVGQPHNETAVLHNQNGVKYFRKAFYELTPKSKKKEALQYFDLASKEFQKAIIEDENFVEAHRNLARTYHVQKMHLQAAEQYNKVSALNPGDLDAYILAALAYLELGRFSEALERIETAKMHTADETILVKLNGYIGKIEMQMVTE